MQGSPPNNPLFSRNHGLDTLRSTAILLVFMYHYQVFVSHQVTFGWLSRIGWVGVDLFFVLSGYLISNQIFSGIARGQTFSAPLFYVRRALRTLPNYWFVLALYFLFPVAMGGSPPPPLWKFLSFTQNFWLTPGTAFSHAWSLCIEEQFYLLFPAIILIGLRFGRSLWLAWFVVFSLVLIGVLARSWLWTRYGHDANGGYYPNIYYSSFARFDEFLPGVAIALLKNFHRVAWAQWVRHGNATLGLGLCFVAAMFWAIDHYYVNDDGYGFFLTTFGYSMLAMAFAILVVAALSPSSWLYRLRIPGAAALALWSYAIYLVHKPIAMIANRLLKPCELAPAALIVIISLACLGGGWMLHRLIERPFLRLRDSAFPSSFGDNGGKTAIPRGV